MKTNWFRKVWPFGIASFACAPALQAQDLPPVLSITLTNVGPQSVSDAAIRAHMRVREGEQYNRRMVADDVENLHKTGYFLNVQVTEAFEEKGVSLVYILQAKPKLTDIVFQGNKKYSNNRLLKSVTSKPGDTLDEKKLFNDVQAIKQKYQKAGYPRTEVKYVTSIDERSGRGSVTFEITESPKVIVKDVSFEGVEGFSQRKLRKQIKTRRHWMFSFITGSGVLKDDVLEEDKDKLTQFFQEEGFIDFEITNIEHDYKNPKHVRLKFELSQGKKYNVGTVEFEGNKLYTTNDLSKAIKMGPGEIFTPKALNKDLEAVRDEYGKQGHIDARVREEKIPNTDTGNMDLKYRIQEGSKSYIEKIEIKGNTKTKDKVIRRELSVVPGEVFDMTEVKRSKKRLEGLRYFKQEGGVELRPEETEVPDRRNLIVTVEEENTGAFSLGAGFSSIDSVLGFVEFNQGNFDIANPPTFQGAGQKYRMRVAYGARRQDYEISFTEPWFMERRLQMSVDLFHRELGFVSLGDYYDERRTGARIGLARALGTENLIGSISYTIENVGIVNVDHARASQIIKDEAGNRLVSKVGTSLAYDTRDDALLPTKGQRTELSGELAGGPFGGQTDFYKLEFRTAWYFKGFDDGHLWEFIGRTGVVEEYGDSPRVPIFDRWFLGGMWSLRGYRYRGVGPRDTRNEPIGGNSYWFGSAEYSIPLIDRLRFATFYDIGMVYSEAYHWNLKHYNDNVGIGFRLNLPIGPLRLDYGIPITSERGVNDSNGRFQFGVGYTRAF